MNELPNLERWNKNNQRSGNFTPINPQILTRSLGMASELAESQLNNPIVDMELQRRNTKSEGIDAQGSVNEVSRLIEEMLRSDSDEEVVSKIDVYND